MERNLIVQHAQVSCPVTCTPGSPLNTSRGTVTDSQCADGSAGRFCSQCVRGSDGSAFYAHDGQCLACKKGRVALMALGLAAGVLLLLCLLLLPERSPLLYLAEVGVVVALLAIGLEETWVRDGGEAHSPDGAHGCLGRSST